MFLKYWQADHLNDLCLQLQKKIITCQKGNSYRTSIPELLLCTQSRMITKRFSPPLLVAVFYTFPYRYTEIFEMI